MSFGMIPNPKKSVIVDFSTDEIKSTLIKLPKLYANKYTLEKQNDIMNQYTFGALEFLSLGVYIDFNLNYVSETKTNIIVEVRRKIGAFDQAFEVQKANEHIEKVFTAISYLLTNIRNNAVTVEAANHTKDVSYNLSWEDVKKHYNTFLLTYPTVYKSTPELASEASFALRRFPQKSDDYAIDIDAIIKVTKLSSTEKSSVVRYEITNDNNKITTQGELNRSIQILKNTINLHQKIINIISENITKAEAELKNIKKWKMGRSDNEKQKKLKDKKS